MLVRSGPSLHEFKKNSDVAQFPKLFSDLVKSYGEVYFWEKGNFHLVTRAQDAKFVLTDKAFSADRGSFFISRMPNLDLSLLRDFFGVVKPMMVMSDDDEHAKRRKAATAGFEDHILERFTGKVHQTVKDLLNEVKMKRSFDFAQTVAKKLPSAVLADLFSIPREDRELFFRCSNIMTGFFGGASQYRNEDGIEVNEAAKALKAYFEKLILEREKNPGEDYVSLVIQASKDLHLSKEELISQLIMMLVAGQVTTTDQINNIMFMLAQRPELQDLLKNRPELIPNAIEELKRLDPAVTFIFRVARAETRIGDQPIKAGDVIFISTHAINRDLPQEESPDEINIHRRGLHFAYGFGAHHCLGAKLARMEMTYLFSEILKNLPVLKLDASQNAERDHYSASFSGFKHLPVVVSA